MPYLQEQSRADNLGYVFRAQGHRMVRDGLRSFWDFQVRRLERFRQERFEWDLLQRIEQQRIIVRDLEFRSRKILTGQRCQNCGQVRLKAVAKVYRGRGTHSV
jgi:hypothetical protein